MPWEEIAATLSEFAYSILEELFDDIVENAEQNPEEELELDDEQIALLEEAVQEAVESLNSAAIDDLPAEVPAGFEFSAIDAAITFFITKQITDGIRGIHGAMVARQILPADRPNLASEALNRARDRIALAAQSEASASFALKHQELALDVGFTYYKYHTSEDDVVRTEHRNRNQRIFRYGAERTVDDVPGLANRCRCFAEPLEVEEALQGTFFYPEDSPAGLQARADFKQMKRKFKIHAEGQQVHIDLVGAIDYYEANDYNSFVEKVSSYLENDEQELHINITSHGGNGTDSMLAYDYLVALPNKVVSNIYGYAGSAATHFAVAADVTTIGENDNFFIHQAWSCPCGNKGELMEFAEQLRVFDESQIDIYVNKTGMSREAVEELLNAERIISAEDAEQFGFVDEIRPDSKRSKAARGEPVAQATHSALLQAHQPTSNLLEENTMKLEDIIKALASDAGLKAKLLKELGGSAESDDSEGGTEIAALKAENAQLKIDNEAKQSVINAAQSTAAESETPADDRESIRAELKAEMIAEAKAVKTITAEVKAAGLEVEGDDATTIMASAIEQAGGKSKDSNDNLFPAETLSSIWASVKTFRSSSSNAAEVQALGQNASDAVVQAEHVKGSRADRINS